MANKPDFIPSAGALSRTGTSLLFPNSRVQLCRLDFFLLPGCCWCAYICNRTFKKNKPTKNHIYNFRWVFKKMSSLQKCSAPTTLWIKRYSGSFQPFISPTDVGRKIDEVLLVLKFGVEWCPWSLGLPLQMLMSDPCGSPNISQLIVWTAIPRLFARCCETPAPRSLDAMHYYWPTATVSAISSCLF